MTDRWKDLFCIILNNKESNRNIPTNDHNCFEVVPNSKISCSQICEHIYNGFKREEINLENEWVVTNLNASYL